jgi:putative transposase
MQLVEQHVIDKTDPRYAALDRAAFASKNLYNAALYEQRQAFIFRDEYIGYEELYHCMSQEAGISRTAMVEIAIREAAKKRNITLKTESKEK